MEAIDVNQPASTSEIPLQSQAVSDPVNKRKGFFPIILGVLILLLIIGSGAYYLGTQKSNSAQSGLNIPFPTTSQQSSGAVNLSPTTIIDNINNWKTYTSKYGYTFDYPSSWGVEDSMGDNGAQIWSKPEYFALSEQQQQGFNKEDYARIEVSMYLNGNNTAFGKVDANTDLQTFIKTRHGSSLISITNTTLDGIPALLATVKREVLKDEFPIGIQNCPSAEPCTIESGKVKYAWAKVNGNILNINYWYGRKYNDYKNLDALFDNLISTFKLTN